MYSKITLTGDLGSGKSVVSRILCAETGFDYISTGRIQRQLAQEMGIDTLEMNRLADVDPTIDQRIDSIFVSLGEDPHGYVVDSRMAWFFLPDSFKIYLQTEPAVAATRIFRDPDRNSELYKDEAEAIQKIIARKQSENARFLSKYGADGTNLHNFDLVVDTNERSQQEVARIVLRALEVCRMGVPFPRFF